MPWAEADRLVTVILRDTASPLTAELAGWDYPLSREAMALADLFDLTVAAHAGRKAKDVTRYPRPWPAPEDPDAKTYGANNTHLTQDEIRSALKRFGKPAPLPQEQEVTDV